MVDNPGANHKVKHYYVLCTSTVEESVYHSFPISLLCDSLVMIPSDDSLGCDV